MNAGEAKERETIEKCQFTTLQQLRKQYDKLIDMASKELIREDKFKEKSEELLSQIKKAEEGVSDTNNRASSWREAMNKTIDVIAHGRERFENGGSIDKRDVLLALGAHPTLYDGVVELTPFEWLIPIKKDLPQLQEALSNVQPQDLQIGNPALEPIRTSWLGRRDSNPRMPGPKPGALPLGDAPIRFILL